MRYIDVHCHLYGGYFGEPREFLQKFKAAGVEKVVAVGVDVPTSEYCRHLAEENDGVYFTAGFHPTELDKYRDGDLNKIKELAAHEKCVAIGEIGLDYHYFDELSASQIEEQKRVQRDIFLRQLHLAQEVGLPVQIHSRDCAQDTLNVIKENISLLKNGFLMHCFSYSPEVALEIERLGGYFSFGGTSTYSGSKRAKKSIIALGESRLMTETDSPYMPPKSKCGTFPNTPESIPEILDNMAGICGISAGQMSEIVWQNAHALFKKLR